jgi:serine/threonine protein kinase
MTQTANLYDFLQPPTQDGDLGMLGTYRIIGELGRGGMGFVFRAVDTVLERPVALKVMNKKIASTPNSRDRFLQEARAMAAVHHDNVVVIFEVGTHEGTPFMAMEMLRGETLEAVNHRKERIDYERVIEYARQIARGLAAAHAKGIVHRDIKPANIWVEQGSGRIKILDFGLALAQSTGADTPGMGSVCGTPGYLTPEQARSDPLDDRSDLYSLGVVLYEMCTGQLPTAQAAIAEQLVALLTGTPTPLRELNPDIPAPLADLIHQLLAKEPGERPANALALDKQLTKVARECEAKSEVAVSLSKLQESLKEVVSKQEVRPEVIEVAEELPSFDALAIPPASLTPVAPVTPNPATAPLRRVSPPGSKAKSTEPPSPPLSPLVWAGAGILGTLILVLGIVWAFIIPHQTDNNVVMLPPAPSTTQQPTVVPQPEPTPTPPPAPQQSQSNNPSPAVMPPDQPKQPNQPSKQTQNNAKEKAPRNPVKPNKQDEPDSRSTSTEEPIVAPEISTETEIPMSVAAPDSDGSRSSAPVDVSEPLDTMEEDDNDQLESEAPTRNVRVNTAEGMGADSTVRKGARDSLATEKLLRVQTLKDGGEEKQHIHLRFDLQSLGVEYSQIRSASIGLVLSKADDENLQSTQLKLYGYADPGAESWVEEDGRKAIMWGNSISREGLESLPLLAEWTYSDLQPQNPNVVFLRSPKVAEFIREAKGKTVSFVVSGGNAEGSWVNFFSKESSPTTAPNLIMQVAEP